ncbi:hypothetical protein [Streptomyces sp. NPDC005302]|uniref:deoxynucleotide monophosphate kinase family protein n=1 Tax=Streptomyces sp. NPDC005302 TaxID=3154675 RepID=UPI0033A4EC6C
MGNIGIIGRAQHGKDTAGKFFVDGHGYRRVALADPLKEAALALDSLIPVHDGQYWRLASLVRSLGWERIKDMYPEVRRTLQHLGAAMRAVDSEIWLRAALAKTQEANDAGVPVVITDVRYRNEAESLKRAGFHLIHIHRPGVPKLDHESEGALGWADAHFTVVNNGDIPQLHGRLESIWGEIYALESARHLARI